MYFFAQIVYKYNYAVFSCGQWNCFYPIISCLVVYRKMGDEDEAAVVNGKPFITKSPVYTVIMPTK